MTLTIRKDPRMTRSLVLVALVALGGTVGCADTLVPDLNNSSIAGFQASPTGVSAGAISIGLLRGARDNAANIVETLGMFGREGYEMSGARGDLPLYIIGPLVPGSFFVQNIWSGQYADLRAANVVLDALGNVPDLTTAQKEAMRGWIQTFEAYDLTALAMTRDTFGIPIAVDIPATGSPAPIATKAQVYQHILNLLDSAQTHLQAGGSSFSFALPPGMANFSTPAAFLTLNRALRARVDLLISDYASAETDLAASFLTTTGSLSYGASFDFTNNSGDETNPRYEPYYYAEPQIVANAQLQPGGARDERVLTKMDSVQQFAFDGIVSEWQFTLYTSPTSSISMIRNEELILMRAEAELGLGQNAQAIADINLIRAESGGLAPTTLTPASSANDLLEELLYNKRYSLMWEGGHSWIDYRQYNKLSELPNQLSTEKFFPILPYPLAECQALSTSPEGCTTVNGF